MGTGLPVVGCLRAVLYARTGGSQLDIVLERRSAYPSTAEHGRRRV